MDFGFALSVVVVAVVIAVVAIAAVNGLVFSC